MLEKKLNQAANNTYFLKEEPQFSAIFRWKLTIGRDNSNYGQNTQKFFCYLWIDIKNGVLKKFISRYQNTFKGYVKFQCFKDLAQKLSVPCPFLFWTQNGLVLQLQNISELGFILNILIFTLSIIQHFVQAS